MKFPRTLAVFLCAAGGILTVAVLKALLISGLAKLPPVKILIFASSVFGLLAVLVERVVRDLIPRARIAPQPDRVIEPARQQPIVFREICAPAAQSGLSFYGGAPIGPPQLAWPRLQNQSLSFVMQWDCAELSRHDATGLLPKDGALYLFADLSWNDQHGFQFVHAKGPVHNWRPLPVPSDLSPIYGANGAYQIPYCSPRIAKEKQDVPRLLPKWPFTPLSLSYPGAHFWEDGSAVAEQLLALQHPEGVPPPARLDSRHLPFARPFPSFPHDHAAIRVVATKVLEQLRHPQSLLRGVPEADRQARFEAWAEQARQHYESAAARPPQDEVERSLSDSLWSWMESLQPVLTPGGGRLVQECANVSLGLESQAIHKLPPELVAACAEKHRLALAYLHDEHPDHSKPEALAAWKARKAEGSLKEVRTVHAACPNHMFGPPSFVQGHVEEYIGQWLLLLELSSHQPVGHEFGEGVLQFLIQPVDLQQGRFDKVKLIASAY